MSNYNVDSIKILSDIEHVRLRPGMYIGECNHPGHLFSEIYDNALDELQNGYGNLIKVNVDYDSNIYRVSDNGRGIPIGEKVLPDGSRKSALVALLTMTNSGGKFDNEAFKLRAGLHGVGSTVVNALSEHMKVVSVRDNKNETVICNKGQLESDEVISNDSDNHGTYVEFKPDSTIFSSSVIPKTFIINRCKIASALGIRLV